MTVCVVGMGGGSIFGASDRMITAGDIQFEPFSAKVQDITNSIAMLTAGDASLNAEISQRVIRDAQAWVKRDSKAWLPVATAVDFYVNAYRAVQAMRGEAGLLRPLGLTTEEFFARMKTFDGDFVRNTVYDLQNHAMPGVEAIITGIDETGPHIYTIYNGDPRCDDSVGFAAIGSGARLAESHFMAAPQAVWRQNEGQAALTTYIAKRRAERAPGVGVQTDLFTVGPELGSLSPLVQEAWEELPKIYDQLVAAEQSATIASLVQMQEFTARLQEAKKAREAGGDGAEQEAGD